MKKILISIRPQWVAKILNGEKTVEVRKTAPKCELPCEVYIYCTNGRDVIKPSKTNPQYRKIKAYTIKKGCVCAKFALNKVEEIERNQFSIHWTKTLKGTDLCEMSCLTPTQLSDYLRSKKGYAWHIDDLVIFDKPKGLEEFKKVASKKTYTDLPWLEPSQKAIFKSLSPLTKAPQSWCYCEVDE